MLKLDNVGFYWLYKRLFPPKLRRLFNWLRLACLLKWGEFQCVGEILGNNCVTYVNITLFL